MSGSNSGQLINPNTLLQQYDVTTGSGVITSGGGVGTVPGTTTSPSASSAGGGGTTNISASGSSSSSGQVSFNDTRLRLSPFSTAMTQILGPSGPNNILNPLYATGGLMFPYTPQITVTQDVDYQDMQLIHTNSDILAYRRTPSVQISLSGKFTCQTQIEGQYTLAAIHFLRVVSKMYFGAANFQTSPAFANRGLPPPVLLLTGYGTYMFNNLRVILKTHNYTFNEQMDTVLVQSAGGTARLPALMDISLTLVVQQTPNMLKNQFNLDLFRTGQLLQNGGWI